MGRIERLTKSKVEQRGDTRLATVWIDSGLEFEAPPELSALARSSVDPLEDQHQPALVLVGPHSDAVEEWLSERVESKQRTYVLVGPSGLSDGATKAIANNSKVMLRRVPEVPVSAVHAGEAAQLCIGGGFVLHLDDRQSESLRQVFLRLFWHHASQETWPESGKVVWRPARQRPFDVPDLPPNAPLRLLSNDARLQETKDNALLHIADGEPPDGAARRIWFPVGADHHAALRRLVERGVDVAWDELGLPDICIHDDVGELLMAGSEHRLFVELTKTQASDLVRVLESRARWTFETNPRIGEPRLAGADLWLQGASEPRGLVDEQPLSAPDVQAQHLREVEGGAPSTFPVPDPLALRVRYEWVVVPPRLPLGATEDPLVGQWRKLDKEWRSRLERLRVALTEVESEQERLSRAFSRLASALLGFGKKQSGLLDEVEGLLETRLAVEAPRRVHELLGRLVDLEEETDKTRNDLRAAEDSAREEEERERQEAAWKSRVGKAKQDLEDRRAEFEIAEPERDRLERKKDEIEVALADAEKSDRQDLLVARARNQDDLKNARKKVNRLTAEIAALEKDAAEQFELHTPKKPSTPGKKSGARFVPQASAKAPIPPVPSEALPRVGALRMVNKERYLVIENWEELEQGEHEASRMSASLVAREDV